MKTRNYSKGDLNAKAEIAMMGRVVEATNTDDLEYIIDYITKTLRKSTDAKDILQAATKYAKDLQPTGLIMNTICGEMQCLTVVLKDPKETSFELDSEQGVLCYVYNYTCPDFSELGYCFFEKEAPGFKRVG